MHARDYVPLLRNQYYLGDDFPRTQRYCLDQHDHQTETSFQNQMHKGNLKKAT